MLRSSYQKQKLDHHKITFDKTWVKIVLDIIESVYFLRNYWSNWSDIIRYHCDDNYHHLHMAYFSPREGSEFGSVDDLQGPGPWCRSLWDFQKGGAVGIVGIIQEKPWAKTLEKPTLKIFEVDFAIYFRLVVLSVYELFRRQIWYDLMDLCNLVVQEGRCSSRTAFHNWLWQRLLDFYMSCGST